MMSKKTSRTLLDWQAYGPRIIEATFRTTNKRISMHVIQCYAPTNDANETDKDLFYSRLQYVVDQCPKRNVTLLMGDLNAKVGHCNRGYESVMGRHGLGNMNENGERFADFCSANELVIGGTVFPHNRIR